jgi:hypothetical protein
MPEAARLAALGWSRSRERLAWVRARTPARQLVTIEDVADFAVFRVGDSAAGLTGSAEYIVAGDRIVGWRPGEKVPSAPRSKRGREVDLAAHLAPAVFSNGHWSF